MTLAEDIQAVRDIAAVPFESIQISDDDMTQLVITKGINGTVSYLWTRYASSLTGLVDVSESGSSRKLSDLHKNALAMAKTYGDLWAAEISLVTRRPTTRAIVRP